jgi:hypothetical protein
MTFLLGEDGKVHTGEVVWKMSATLMQTDCKVIPLRPVGEREVWWHDDDWRICDACLAEVA